MGVSFFVLQAMTVWVDEYNKLSEFELERMSFYAGEKYAHFSEEGTYHCARCRSQVYSSTDKYTPEKPLDEFPTFKTPANDSIKTQRVYSFGMKSTQVKCSNCSLHLGYIFLDSKGTDLQYGESERHCILSLCLEFVPNNESPPISEPAFANDPKVVYEHLEQQDEAAREIIESGHNVEIKEVEEEEDDSVLEDNSGEQKTTEEPEESNNTKSTNTSQNENSNGKSKTPTKNSEKSPSPSPSARGVPQNSTVPDNPSFSSDVTKPAPRTGVPVRIIVAPIVLALVGSVIVYFAYKSTQEKK